MNVLDLFSGIGGFSVGLEAAGMDTMAFCEIVPHARAILKRHWPDLPQFVDIPVYDDVTTITAARLAQDGISVDLVCGGFPCQDISLSGTGEGLDGARSGLWFEMLRIITDLAEAARGQGQEGPWAIIENVAALRSRGLDEVLRGLAAIGYDAEWHCIPASAVGAPHRRDRIWIVAYPNGDVGVKRGLGYAREGEGRRDTDRSPVGKDVADADCPRKLQPQRSLGIQWGWVGDGGSAGRLVADAHKPRLEILLHGEAGEQPSVERTHAWPVEPNVGRVAYGVPSRVDRITRLGNAVVPKIPEAIGRAIMRYRG